MTDQELEIAIKDAENNLQWLKDQRTARQAFKRIGKFIATWPGYGRVEFLPGQDWEAAYWLSMARSKPVSMQVKVK